MKGRLRLFDSQFSPADLVLWQLEGETVRRQLTEKSFLHSPAISPLWDSKILLYSKHPSLSICTSPILIRGNNVFFFSA